MSARPTAPGTEPGLVKGATIGRHVVLGLLGRGGMGEVYAAYDPELDRKIAVKLLRARGASSTDGRTRLLREAQAIARLSHPNVVVVYDVGTFEDQIFIAMEFVEGHTLGYWLEAQPRPWREVLNVFMAAGRGLVAAHAAGLMHRDFKPDNVMITKGGEVRVMDFGLARAQQVVDAPAPASQLAMESGARAAALAHTMPPEADPDATANLGVAGDHSVPAGSGGYLRLKLTQTGAMLGTPAYMAPEQFAGVGGDARTDQFAFSVALYEGLYGQRPFPGANVVELMANVVAGTIAAPPESTRVPSWIRKIVMRGLAASPADRFASMTDMLAALGRDPTARRRRALGAAAALAVVIGIAAGTHRLSAGQRAMCAGGPARVAGAWGPARRAAVEHAFKASGHKGAAQTFAATARLLDTYAAQWTGMYGETCEATQVRGEQSAEVLDLRMGCLGERLASAQALTDIFAAADRGVVDNAVSAAGALPTLDRCADVAMLRAVIRPPDDPGKRAEVDKLQAEVAKVSALASAGRCDQATTIGGPVREAARRLGYKPLEAEIAYALGRLFDTCLDPKQALGLLEDAVMAAEASRHEQIAIEASVTLGGAYANLTHDTRRGDQWVRLGEAISARFQGHPRLQAWVASTRGIVLYREGRFEESLQAENRALAIRAPLLGPSSLEVAMSANNLATVFHELGRDEEAEVRIRQAIDIFATVFGEDNGRIAVASLNACEILTALRRFDAAHAAIDNAIRIWRQQSASPFHIGIGYLYRGKLELAEGATRAAIASLEGALEQLGTQDPHLLADARFSLAQALLTASPRPNARARDLARSAREGLVDQPAAASLLRRIETWQREHPAATRKPG